MTNNLTIVIPVYNVKDYLGECLESIKGEDFKIILVNDGSTDGSDLICRQFQQTNENVFLIEKTNGGLSDARNAAYNYIDTEYVFFLDSDDYINTENLRLALDFAKNNNLDWLQCGYVYKYKTYSLINEKYDRPSMVTTREVVWQLINDSYIKNFAWGKIYKTSVIRNFLFPKGKYFEDVLWQYQVVSHSGKLGIFPSVVTYYRQRSDGISGIFSVKNLDLLSGLKDRLDCILKNYPDFEPLAAFKMWRLCTQYKALSEKQTDEKLRQQLISFEKSLLAKYESEIRKVIKSQGFRQRMEYRAAIDGRWYRLLLAMTNKIVERFSNDGTYRIVKDD